MLIRNYDIDVRDDYYVTLCYTGSLSVVMFMYSGASSQLAPSQLPASSQILIYNFHVVIDY